VVVQYQQAIAEQLAGAGLEHGIDDLSLLVPADGAAGQELRELGVGPEQVLDQRVELLAHGVHLAAFFGGAQQGLGVDAGHALGADVGGVREWLFAGFAHTRPSPCRFQSVPACRNSDRASSTSRRWSSGFSCRRMALAEIKVASWAVWVHISWRAWSRAVSISRRRRSRSVWISARALPVMSWCRRSASRRASSWVTRTRPSSLSPSRSDS